MKQNYLAYGGSAPDAQTPPHAPQSAPCPFKTPGSAIDRFVT